MIINNWEFKEWSIFDIEIEMSLPTTYKQVQYQLFRRYANVFDTYREVCWRWSRYTVKIWTYDTLAL